MPRVECVDTPNKGGGTGESDGFSEFLGPNVLPVNTRRSWGAKPSRGIIVPLDSPVSNIFCAMHTYTQSCLDDFQCNVVLRYLQHKHFEMFPNLADIPFNFLISNTGIYECRGWDKRPTLPKRFAEFNMDGFFIGFIGPGRGLPPGTSVSLAMLKMREEITMVGIRNGTINPKHTLYNFYTYADPKDVKLEPNEVEDPPDKGAKIM